MRQGTVRDKAMGLFLSTFTNKLDSKGRVSVPAPFRSVLTESKAQRLMLFPSFVSRAIEGGGPELVEAISEAMNQDYAFFSEEQAALSGQVFGNMVELAWDADGRIVLPEPLIAHAGIDGQAMFVGMGPSFQIWEPGAYEQVRAAARTRLAANPPKISLRRRGV